MGINGKFAESAFAWRSFVGSALGTAPPSRAVSRESQNGKRREPFGRRKRLDGSQVVRRGSGSSVRQTAYSDAPIAREVKLSFGGVEKILTLQARKITRFLASDFSVPKNGGWDAREFII